MVNSFCTVRPISAVSSGQIGTVDNRYYGLALVILGTPKEQMISAETYPLVLK